MRRLTSTTLGSEWVRGAAAIAALLLLSGCSAPVGDESEYVVDVSGVSAEQAAELEDEQVTEDEYRAAFERFRACVADGGFDLVVNGESFDLIDYAIPVEANEAGVDEPCYRAEFEQVDTVWQLAHEDTSYTAEVFRECLAERGIDPADTVEGMHDQLTEAGIDAGDCFPE